MERTGWRVVREGLVAGVLGYVTVAVVIALADLALGRALFTTPGAIGGVLFFGASDPASALVSPGPVAAANGLHLLVSLALGVGAALLAIEAEAHPRLLYLAFVLVVMFVVATSSVLVAVPTVITRATPAAVALLAGFAGGLVVAAYLAAVHPRLRSELGELAGAGEADYTPAH